MRFEHEPRFSGEILDARPLGDEWAFLRKDRTMDNVPLSIAGLGERVELHISLDGGFAAVTQRFGQFGHVFDLSTGNVTLELDRGTYYPEYTVFPFAFFPSGGRMLVAHGADWNRLDVSDASTGDLLTTREPTAYTEGEPEPSHYLDYFHAGLHVSPDSRWIAEDGWYWHPLGEVRLWSLIDWLQVNVWESEDGPSIRKLTDRDYFWDTPMTWLDNNRLAFWGEGDEADEMKPVIRVYRAREAKEVQRIPGPEITPARPWPPGSERAGWIAYDEWLFAISPEKGTGVWDLEGGELLHFEADFAPRRYHSGRKEFLSWDENGAWASRLVP